MTFLPIVERELLVQARQKRTHRLRLAGAAMAIALVSFMLVLNTGFSTPGSLGHGLFETLAWLAGAYCLLSGAGNTVDCLSEEKREGTLGLLFLTDLKGYDVVLGKLLATSLNNFYGLLAIFQPLAITFCLGGVTAGEFWRLVLQLTNTLFFSLAVGMFVSAISRDEQRAWAAALTCLALSGPVLLLVFLSGFDARYVSSSGVFWTGFWMIFAAGWVLHGLASFILPRAWQDRPLRERSDWTRSLDCVDKVQKTKCGGQWFSQWFARFRDARRREQQRLLALNPVLWLAARRTSSVNPYLWIVVLLAGGVGLIIPLLAGGAEPVMVGLFCSALVLHYLLVLWAAFQASYLFAEARASGTLEMLLATPLTVDQVIDGYFSGLKRVLVAPIVTLLVLEGLVILELMFFLGLRQGVLIVPQPLFLGAGICLLLFISDLFAVGRFGMWMGLKSKKPSQAFAKTVLYVMVLPLFSVCLCVAMPLVWLLKNAIFSSQGEFQLRRNFRALLNEGAEAKAESGRLPSVVEPGDER